jgi:hypothetical protein
LGEVNLVIHAITRQTWPAEQWRIVKPQLSARARDPPRIDPGGLVELNLLPRPRRSAATVPRCYAGGHQAAEKQQNRGRFRDGRQVDEVQGRRIRESRWQLNREHRRMGRVDEGTAADVGRGFHKKLSGKAQRRLISSERYKGCDLIGKKFPGENVQLLHVATFVPANVWII